MFGFGRDRSRMVSEADALAGRFAPIPTAGTHHVSGKPLKMYPAPGLEAAMFGMGCFWGVERRFWELEGVVVTMVGYAGGYTPNPTYEEVCTGRTGHNEVVLIHYDPHRVNYETLLRTFWEGHDPTQGMAQGEDRGTQYRSGIYVFDEDQRAAAQDSLAAYQDALHGSSRGTITTEIRNAPQFYFAEAHHQQYLAKNPGGYCGLGGTGIPLPAGIAAR